MALINWKAEYSVNIREIDEQHKKLIGMINELHDGMKSGKGKDALSKILYDLVNYTVTHFAKEEALFVKYNYPETTLHMKQHKELISQVASIQKRYESGESVLTIEIMTFLKDWLNDHIIGSDKKYTAHLNSKGIL